MVSVCSKVLGIDIEHLLKRIDGLRVFLLQEIDSSYLVQIYAITRVLRLNSAQRCKCSIVVPIGLLDHGLEEMNTRKRAVDAQRLLDEWLGAIRLAFLNQRSRDVQPAIGVARLGLRHTRERVFGPLQIALQ